MERRPPPTDVTDDDDHNGDDPDIDPLVPSSFSVTLERSDERDLKPHTFVSLKNRHVILRANGFTYRGLLRGADEDELYLRGELRWFVLPLATVTSVAPDPERRAENEAADNDAADDAPVNGALDKTPRGTA